MLTAFLLTVVAIPAETPLPELTIRPEALLQRYRLDSGPRSDVTTPAIWVQPSMNYRPPPYFAFCDYGNAYEKAPGNYVTGAFGGPLCFDPFLYRDILTASAILDSTLSAEDKCRAIRKLIRPDMPVRDFLALFGRNDRFVWWYDETRYTTRLVRPDLGLSVTVLHGIVTEVKSGLTDLASCELLDSPTPDTYSPDRPQIFNFLGWSGR